MSEVSEKRVCLGCGGENLLRRPAIMSDECPDCGLVMSDFFREWEFVEKGVVRHRKTGRLARLQPDGQSFKVEDIVDYGAIR